MGDLDLHADGDKSAFGLDGRALNALTHGLTANRVLAAERRAYEKTAAKLVEEWAPRTSMERALVRRIARLIVRLERAAMVDAISFANCFVEPVTGDDAEFNQLAFLKLVETVAHYELAMGRALAKAQHELDRLISKREGGPTTGVVSIVDFNW